VSSDGLRDVHRVLSALGDRAPHSLTEIKRVLGWDVVGDAKAATVLLQRMRRAGLVEAVSVGVAAKWKLADGCTVCPTCAGRGITRE